MDDELKRLINTLLDDVECFSCNTELDIQANELERKSQQVYTARHDCPGDNCNIEYDVRVENRDLALLFDANERGTDRPERPADISKTSRKEPLQKESHPVRKLTDAAAELTNAIAILHHNQQRLQEAHDTIEDEGIDQDGDFHRRVRADVHNYTAAAYSFEEILGKNVEPHLPSDGSIEDAKNKFKRENEVIKALRTYGQHHLTLPSSLVHFLGPTTDDTEITITVPIDDLDDFRPGDPEASFEPVDGDHIDVMDRVNRHYEAAENLVDTMLEVAEEEYEERVDEYREVTSYPEMGGE
ncbi:hypothetical protein [Halostella salina]|uniref:hypothetical protein n=1 Tax=Halostella salina TaxID=1547897 RepID=UPI000EF7FAF1|nr:hypothetical protein [Halostella salina]